jgi:general secretion pathway protein K
MRARTPTAGSPGHRAAAVSNQRGVALLVVLMVVALLTITVLEFTYSVQIDMHRTRNALHALQAQLLARSGVNLAEGFLMADEEPGFDSYSEEWWLGLIEFCKGVQLDETTLMRCRVRDESGKININNTKAPKRLTQGQQITRDAILRDAMRCMFEGIGIDVEIVDKLTDYWQQDPPLDANGQPSQIPDFTSLEDFGATFGIPPEQLDKLRPFLTAQPSGLLRGININTAPRGVLAVVLTDDAGAGCAEPADVVAEIMERQVDLERPFKTTAEVQSVIQGLDNAPLKRALFEVRSRLYRLEASALSNIDPEQPSGGGIGQTLSVLVLRVQDSKPRPGGPVMGANGNPLPNWTLRPLDWQKEGGARLFRSVPSEDENLPGSPDDEEEPDAG